MTRTSPPSRLLRSIAVAVTLTVGLSACQSTASVEIMNDTPPTIGTAAPRPSESNGDDNEPSASTSEPRFVLDGELPLSTQDVNSLIEFIEAEAGRSFLRPPVIVAQSAEAFSDGLLDDLEDFEGEAELTVRQLQALGLTDQGVAEVAAAFRALLLSPEGIQGYYDPEPDELYVPIDVLGDDEFRSLLVHELTHALDGQHADLSRLQELSDEAELTRNYEPLIGFQAVGEGRASAIQNRWMRANAVTQELPDDLGAIERVPPHMVLSLSVPYAFGEQFIEANGGPGNTWDLLDNPPVSSEDFLVPGNGIGVETVIDVATPPADGPVLDTFTFGAVDIFTWLLGESLEPDPALIFPTFAALDGWAGGKAVLWGNESESCVRATFAADSELDLGELQSAFELWASDDPARSVTVTSDRVTVTGCAPYVP